MIQPTTWERGKRSAQRARRKLPASSAKSADTIAADRADLSADLHAFVAAAWRVLEPRPMSNNWHIGAICDHLEAVARGDIKQLVINVPPRSSKSLLACVFWPAWVWTHEPSLKWLYASFAQTLSVRDSVRCRRLIESPWYQERWGDVYALRRDQNTKMRFDNDRNGYRYATSFGTGTTGDGGDIRILDDPHSAQDAHSPVVLASQIEWIRETWSTRYIDAATARDLIIMQRLNERDASGYVLEEELGYEHLCLPAEYEPDRKCVTSLPFEDPRTEEGELLDEKRLGHPQLAKLKKSLGEYGAAGQLQQRPSPAEGGLIKRHWWRYWCYPGQSKRLGPVLAKVGDALIEQWAVELPDDFDELVQSWDMAFKGLKTSDSVSGGVLAKRGADRFLLDRFNEKAGIVATLEAVRDMSDAHPRAYAKYVESAANGPAVVELLQEEIQGLLLVTPHEIGGSKEARVHAVIPQINAGNVFLPHPRLAPWTGAVIEQCAVFPGGAHDDDVDMLTLGLIKLMGGLGARSWDVG